MARRCFVLSLADRDYMKPGYRNQKQKKKKPSLYKRFLFFLYRMKRALFGTD
jgi:hypothetical protein